MSSLPSSHNLDMSTEARTAAQAERDRASIAKIQAGGRSLEDGTKELYGAYRRTFIAYFQRNRMDMAQAEDLLQEVFINVVRRAGDFRAESSVSTWLWTIARHKLIDHTRSVRPEQTLNEDGWAALENSLADEIRDESAHHSLDDCVSKAFQVFAKQAPERAEALRRLTLDGWSTEQIAQFIGRTPGATREYLSQCRKRFKSFLEPCKEFLAA
jgi:RNA polymerase sigma-70 factor, ECF subfamily